MLSPSLGSYHRVLLPPLAGLGFSKGGLGSSGHPQGSMGIKEVVSAYHMGLSRTVQFISISTTTNRNPQGQGHDVSCSLICPLHRYLISTWSAGERILSLDSHSDLGEKQDGYCEPLLQMRKLRLPRTDRPHGQWMVEPRRVRFS